MTHKHRARRPCEAAIPQTDHSSSSSDSDSLCARDGAAAEDATRCCKKVFLQCRACFALCLATFPLSALSFFSLCALRLTRRRLPFLAASASAASVAAAAIAPLFAMYDSYKWITRVLGRLPCVHCVSCTIATPPPRSPSPFPFPSPSPIPLCHSAASLRSAGRHSEMRPLRQLVTRERRGARGDQGGRVQQARRRRRVETASVSAESSAVEDRTRWD